MATKKKVAKKKPANSSKGKAPMDVVTPIAEYKIAKKDYDKFYKLGMKYAREYNKMVLDTRKGLNLNLDQSFGWTDGFVDQSFGWTDGFVEGALQMLYKGMEKREWARYHSES